MDDGPALDHFHLMRPWAAERSEIDMEPNDRRLLIAAIAIASVPVLIMSIGYLATDDKAQQTAGLGALATLTAGAWALIAAMMTFGSLRDQIGEMRRQGAATALSALQPLAERRYREAALLTKSLNIAIDAWSSLNGRRGEDYRSSQKTYDAEEFSKLRHELALVAISESAFGVFAGLRDKWIDELGAIERKLTEPYEYDVDEFGTLHVQQATIRSLQAALTAFIESCEDYRSHLMADVEEISQTIANLRSDALKGVNYRPSS